MPHQACTVAGKPWCLNGFRHPAHRLSWQGQILGTSPASTAVSLTLLSEEVKGFPAVSASICGGEAAIRREHAGSFSFITRPKQKHLFTLTPALCTDLCHVRRRRSDGRGPCNPPYRVLGLCVAPCAVLHR